MSAWQLWFGFLGGMTAFALHLLTVFWAAPLACLWSILLLHLTSALFLMVALSATVVSFRSSRRLHAQERNRSRDTSRPSAPLSGAYLGAVLLRRSRLARIVLAASAATPSSSDRRFEEDRTGDIADNRTEFMALSGLYLNLLSVAAIAFSWAASFVLDPCI